MILEPRRFSTNPTAGKLDVLRPGGFTLTDRVLQLCAFKAGDRVADIGCGFGATVEYLRGSHGIDAWGIDPAAASLEKALQRNPSLPLAAGYAEELPFESGTLDGVVAECSLSVIVNKEQALAEFCRVLRPEGKLAITDVYARSADGLDAIRDIRFPFCMAGIMTRVSLTAMMGRQGFSPTCWEDHSPLLKDYLIQAIMGECGSIFGGTCSGQGEHSWHESIRMLKRTSPGYFVLVASKVT
ncbi:MAG TPA: class I SAM-dependent methyltransferase [Nitrospirota bacterium]|nr:class I SAM-dependent methyltransferase [Nitrospirota bacterium]